MGGRLGVHLVRGVRQISARIARAEAAWLAGDDERARAEAESGLELALTRKEP